jgi:hypothetical protein
MNRIFPFLAAVAFLQPAFVIAADTFYLDSLAGDDANSGRSADQAWKSLSKASANVFHPGDTLALKRGGRFAGGLSLGLQGTAEKPITISAYGEGAAPVIDAKGHLAGVHLKNSRHLLVKDLAITADGGKTRDGSNPAFRYGVYVQASGGATSHVTVENLTIHKIYPETASKHEGKKPTTFPGTAIRGTLRTASAAHGEATVRRQQRSGPARRCDPTGGLAGGTDSGSPRSTGACR